MTRYLVRYTHVEETTYEQWVEADSEEEALEKADVEADFENIVEIEGVELKDFEIVEEE